MTKEEAIIWQQHGNELNLKKTNAHIKQQVIEQTNFLPTNSSLQQRLWHIIHGDNLPICSAPSCSILVKWKTDKKQYNKYCCVQCASKDPIKVQSGMLWKQSPQMLIAATKKGTQARKITNLNKFGHTNYLASAQGKHSTQQYRLLHPYTQNDITQRTNKRISTWQLKYGVQNISHRWIDPISLTKLQNIDWLTDQHLTNKKSLTLIAEELKLTGGVPTVCNYMRKYGIETKYYGMSGGHKQLSQLLIDCDIEHVVNTRTIISPLELDIYIPQFNLAIEYCGLYWHSEQKGKDRHYHKHKHDMCQQQGIQLLTIYEDEWKQRKRQVVNKLMHLLGFAHIHKLFARKTTVVQLDKHQKKQFFEEHHIQGDGPGSITYGLECGGTLVAAMAFIKQPNNIFCLNRYATSCTVVGGFSKILTHFKQSHNWTQIISFADNRWSNGQLYEKTGFVLDSILPPDYYYSPDGYNRFHKFNYRRKNLQKLLKHFDPTLSETVNCNNNGILRIWDCGKRKYTINNSSVV